MKVQFLEPLGGKDFVYVTNKVYDLDKPIAKKYIDAGICVEATEDIEDVIEVKKTVIGKTTKVKKRSKK